MLIIALQEVYGKDAPSTATIHRWYNEEAQEDVPQIEIMEKQVDKKWKSSLQVTYCQKILQFQVINEWQ